jgi:hypothetical protein
MTIQGGVGSTVSCEAAVPRALCRGLRARIAGMLAGGGGVDDADSRLKPAHGHLARAPA